MKIRAAVPVSLALLVSCSGLLAAATDSMTTEAPRSVAIVELFTSEGCSSCPPADALLQQIHAKRTGAGQLIVGISEHVTYWNGLGWKDPYSLPQFTDRQNAYAGRFSLEGPYTPQMVLNGRDQFTGSDAAALARALQEDASRQHAALHILSSSSSGDALTVTFSLTGQTAGPLDLIAVLTDDTDQSHVLHGENGGRLLQHVSVARSLARVAKVRGGAEQAIRVPLPDGIRSGKGPGHHLILFAQQPHQGSIVGAAFLPL